MIKQNDLRIGNMFLYYIGEDGCEWDTTRADCKDIQYCSEKNESFNALYKPMEITDDFLKKECGFKATHKNIRQYAKQLSDNPQNSMVICFEDNENLQTCKVRLYSQWTINPYPLEIKYVHELQNLWHSLTKAELLK